MIKSFVSILVGSLCVTFGSFGQTVIKTYYPSYTDAQGQTGKLELREEYSAKISGTDTLKHGNYTSYFEISGVKQRQGVFENGKENGLFIDYYENSKVKWSREYDSGLLTGTEAYFSPQGEMKYEATYKNTPSSNGDISTSYKKFSPSKKLLAKGSMLNGELNGELKEFYPNEQLQQTFTFTNGSKNGPFVVYDRKGQKIQSGNYISDDLSDSLTTYYPSAKVKSKAFFQHGHPHGELKEFYKNGTIKRLMTYNHDTLDGPIIKYFESGQVKSTSTYVKGHINGEFESFYESGQIESKRTYQYGLKQGKGQDYFINGTIHRDLFYKDDKLDGEIKYYYPTGSKESILNYTDGNQNGLNQYFYKNGKHKTSSNYLEGVLTSSEEFNTEGIKTSNSAYVYKKEPAQVGSTSIVTNVYKTVKIFDVNGILINEAKYVNNSPAGQWTYYFSSGKVRSTEFYKFGKLNGEKISYDETGDIIEKEEFLSNSKHGEHIIYNNKGKAQEITNYKKGLKYGKYSLFDVKGKLITVGNYTANKKNGKWTTYEKGKPVSIEVYKRGELISTTPSD